MGVYVAGFCDTKGVEFDKVVALDGNPTLVSQVKGSPNEYGSELVTTRNWTAGFGPCCHLPIGQAIWGSPDF